MWGEDLEEEEEGGKGGHKWEGSWDIWQIT